MRTVRLVLAITALAASGGAALAAQSPCKAPAPLIGELVSGPVLHVGDAGWVCIAKGALPDQWVEVRLSAGQVRPRNLLMAATFAKRLDCSIIARKDGAPVGLCQVAKVKLDDAIAEPTLQKAALDWR